MAFFPKEHLSFEINLVLIETVYSHLWMVFKYGKLICWLQYSSTGNNVTTNTRRLESSNSENIKEWRISLRWLVSVLSCHTVPRGCLPITPSGLPPTHLAPTSPICPLPPSGPLLLLPPIWPPAPLLPIWTLLPLPPAPNLSPIPQCGPWLPCPKSGPWVPLPQPPIWLPTPLTPNLALPHPAQSAPPPPFPSIRYHEGFTNVNRNHLDGRKIDIQNRTSFWILTTGWRIEHSWTLERDVQIITLSMCRVQYKCG